MEEESRVILQEQVVQEIHHLQVHRKVIQAVKVEILVLVMEVVVEAGQQQQVKMDQTPHQ